MGRGLLAKHQEIFILTPNGEEVPEHEIRWELNPHRKNGKTLQLLEIAPGHHLFKASSLAEKLYKLGGSDLRSQFYKTPSVGETSPTPELPYSDGHDRTIKRQELYASRCQARATKTEKQNAATSPRDNVTVPIPNQKQGRPGTNLGVLFVPLGTTRTETKATLLDSDLFHRNGKPKPQINLTSRPLIRGLTSKARKSRVGRKSNRRRNRRGRPTDEVPIEPNPTSTERSQEEIDPTRPGSDSNPLFPDQHIETAPSLPCAELKLGSGAACFGPNTALFTQDPSNWAAHVPVYKLTRSIGSLKYGDSVLAEKNGQLFPAKVHCVMTFEIPKAMDPDANRTIQENTLTTAMGFTLTSHHHIRNHGQIHRDTQGRWQFAGQEDNMQWMVAADLSRHPIRN